MKKFSYLALGLLVAASALTAPIKVAKADVQSQITRSQVEQRALSMINLTWTYSASKNGTISSQYASYVTQPKQLNNLTTAQVTGIPYNWGGFDGIDSNSYAAPWTSFVDAVNQGAYTGNVNTSSGLGHVPGTAGLDCSGFVQASFNIKADKQSTTTLLNNYFTQINISDLKHMDILDKPGDHVVIFDKWGTLNGISGAFTYESTPDQTYGGIQGTKQYFISMNTINKGYIAARYINIVDDAATTPAAATTTTSTETSTPAATSTTTTTPAAVPAGVFAQVTNINYAANFRANPTTSAAIIGTIPKGTILYLISYSSGWYQVSYNGQTGWISGGLIAQIQSGKYVTVNNATQVNIRSNASSTAAIVGTLNKGQYAEVVGYSTDGSWYKISINGVTGWSYSNYLKYIY